MNISDLKQSANGSLPTGITVPRLTNVWESWRNGEKDAVQQIATWLRLFVTPGQAVELRALNVNGAYRATAVVGFYDVDHLEEMAKEAWSLSGQAQGVYFTFNPLSPDLLARFNNRTERNGSAACDDDVLRRNWLFIDFDPNRTKEISSTEDEKAKAKVLMTDVKAYLTTQGWPEPIQADSGNGYHLLYRVDLPCQDNELVKNVLLALADKFNTTATKIDTNVCNPARITKLYGTLACKGDSIPERPHRLSKIENVPDALTVVPQELLEAMAARGIKPQSVMMPARGFSQPSYRFNHEENVRRARAYLKKVPPAISGQSGHDQAYHAACILAERVGLPVEEALPLMEEWNQTCQPPWSEKELRHKLEDAFEKVASPPSQRILAIPGIQGTVGALLQLKQEDDPNRLAQIFLDTQCTDTLGTSILRLWRGSWCRWNGNCYKDLDSQELRGDIWRAVENEFNQLGQDLFPGRGVRGKTRKVTNDIVSNVLGALASVSIVPGTVNQPAWLDDEQSLPANEILAGKNGLVHLPSLIDGSKEVMSPTPAFFNSMALDYDIDLNAPKPANWSNFLDQLWPNDPESIETLQEWFGYCLLPDTSQQKFLFLLGPPRSGKGTIASVLSALIGKENVAGPTLSGLASHFGLWPLLGKHLAILSDARLSGRADQAVIVERLLAITGEGDLTVERKNLPGVTTKLPTRFLLISNELPKLTDASGALVSRIILLQMRTSWLGKEDHKLLSQLISERPGILLWAIEGLKRLLQRGHFNQPNSSQSSLDQLGELSSPIKAFVDQRCNLDPNKQVIKTVLFQEWKTWCTDRGYFSGNDSTFGRNLVAAFPAIDPKARGGTGDRSRMYQGVEVKRMLF